MTGNGTLNSALPDDTDAVLRYSQRFKDHELRKVLYEVAHQKRAVGELRDAIKIILLGWNWRAYAGTDISNADLDQQIDGFIEANNRLVEYLARRGHTLESVDFQTSVNDIPIGTHIVQNFNEALQLEAVSSTGASKAFHILYPPVFMMWDAGIIEVYHREGESLHWKAGAGKGIHTRGKGECYLAFLKETQDSIQSELDMDQFPDKTPAKIMDEYNYAKYTLDSEYDSGNSGAHRA